jgi:hypothetical protein
MYATFTQTPPYTGYMFHLSGERKDSTAKSDFLIVDPKVALRRLKRLQTQGFGVPQYAVDRLQQEVNELVEKQ